MTTPSLTWNPDAPGSEPGECCLALGIAPLFRDGALRRRLRGVLWTGPSDRPRPGHRLAAALCGAVKTALAHALAADFGAALLEAAGTRVDVRLLTCPAQDGISRYRLEADASCAPDILVLLEEADLAGGDTLPQLFSGDRDLSGRVTGWMFRPETAALVRAAVEQALADRFAAPGTLVEGLGWRIEAVDLDAELDAEEGEDAEDAGGGHPEPWD